MPALTRRRDRQASQETWLIYFGDIHAGTIALRSGNRKHPVCTAGQAVRRRLTGGRRDHR